MMYGESIDIDWWGLPAISPAHSIHNRFMYLQNMNGIHDLSYVCIYELSGGLYYYYYVYGIVQDTLCIYNVYVCSSVVYLFIFCS